MAVTPSAALYLSVNRGSLSFRVFPQFDGLAYQLDKLATYY